LITTGISDKPTYGSPQLKQTMLYKGTKLEIKQEFQDKPHVAMQSVNARRCTAYRKIGVMKQSQQGFPVSEMRK
jgi:hypothetical protein